MTDPIIQGIMNRLAYLENNKAVAISQIATATDYLLTRDALMFIPDEPNFNYADYIDLGKMQYRNLPNIVFYMIYQKVGKRNSKVLLKEYPGLTFNHLVATLLLKKAFNIKVPFYYKLLLFLERF